MKTNSPTESLFDQLRVLYSMEVQVAMSLPVLSGSVMNIRLRKLLSERSLRARERRDQVAFLLNHYGEGTGTGVCTVSKGILAGGKRLLDGVKSPFMRDLVMVDLCLRIEHHESAAYGVSSRLAERGGYVAEALRLAAFQSELDVARSRLKSLESEISTLAESSTGYTEKESDSRSRTTVMRSEPVLSR